MNIQPAQRVNQIQEYYFSKKLKEVAQLQAVGNDIISLAIGSPDMPLPVYAPSVHVLFCPRNLL